MRRFDTIRARNGKNNMNSSVMKRRKRFEKKRMKMKVEWEKTFE
jgi:hypothetical protein